MSRTKTKGQLIQFPGGAHQPRRYQARAPKRCEEKPEEKLVDLNDLLLPANGDCDDGRLLDVTGDYETGEIRDGDKILVDRSIMAGLRDIVVVEGANGFIVIPYRDINDRPIFGVVTHTLRAHRGWRQ